MSTQTIIYLYFKQPIIFSKIRISDTCGVHNLHGMPAVLSAIFSAIYAALATEAVYKTSLYAIFPAMQPSSIPLVNATAHNESMSVEELFGVLSNNFNNILF